MTMEKSEIKSIVREVIQEEILPQFIELLKTSEDRLTGYRNELHSAKIRCESYEKQIMEQQKRIERLQEKYDESQHNNYKMIEKYQALAERTVEKRDTGSSTNINVKV